MMGGMKRKIRCGGKPMTAIVLAGGRGRRMKADKAGLDVGGRTLLEHVLAQIEPYFDEVLVSLSPGQTLRFGEKAWHAPCASSRTLTPGLGPIGGMLAGLKAARHEACAVIACDIPDIDMPLLLRSPGRRGTRTSPSRSVRRASANRSSPSTGDPSSPRSKRSWPSANGASCRFIERCRTSVVRFDDAGRIRNLNTRADYESYC